MFSAGTKRRHCGRTGLTSKPGCEPGPPALALDCLEHHSNRVRADERANAVDVVQPRFRKAGDLRREQRVETRLAARAHRRQRAAMERMLEGDDLERAAAMDLAELARELDRAFVGFGSAVGEEAAIEPAQRGE